jgi:3-keto-5-aminohexanoate cleavage enzyme
MLEPVIITAALTGAITDPAKTPYLPITPDQLVAAALDLSPELASFDAGSMNFGTGVFLNPPDFLDRLARRMRAQGVKPEIEVYDAGMIFNALRMCDAGLLEPPLHFQFVLGVPGGAPATAKSLLHLVEQIPPESTWSVIGIGAGQLPMNLMGMALGGHVRTGLEDNIYYSKGILAKSNSELVARLARIAREFGRAPATPAEARRILGLKCS